MSINSRNKGKAGELELAHELSKFGYEVRRGQQFCGANGDADVVGVPGLHIEVKRVERLDYYKAYEQSENDALESETPVVVHRRNRKRWLVTLSLEDFMRIWGNKNKEI